MSITKLLLDSPYFEKNVLYCSVTVMSWGKVLFHDYNDRIPSGLCGLSYICSFTLSRWIFTRQSCVSFAPLASLTGQETKILDCMRAYLCATVVVPGPEHESNQEVESCKAKRFESTLLMGIHMNTCTIADVSHL